MFTDTYEPQVNGVVTSVRRFTEEMKKRGHEVYIFTPHSEELKKKGFIHSFKSMCFRSYREYKIALPILKGCPKDFDVIHVHSPFTVGMAGIAMAKYYNVPVIGTFHTHLPEYIHYLIKRDKIRNIKQVEKLTKKFTWKYCSWFYNRCNCVIAPSEEIKKTLEGHEIKFRKDIVVIPTGIIIRKKKKYKAVLRRKYGFSKDDKILLHVGRVTKEKNIDIILNTIKPLIKRENVKLIVTSDGPKKDILEKRAEKLGISNNVKFTGYIKGPTLRDYYELSDVFVMASKTETQGLVLAEAASHGLPAVVLEADVTADFVRKHKTGLVASKKELAEKIQKMLKKKEMRNRFIKNGLELREMYGIKNCTTSLMKIYSDLIKAK